MEKYNLIGACLALLAETDACGVLSLRNIRVINTETEEGGLVL